MEIVKKIVAAAESRGLTQQSPEAAAGLSPGRISKWRAGHGEPTARQIRLISRVLGVDVRHLLDDERTVEGGDDGERSGGGATEDHR